MITINRFNNVPVTISLDSIRNIAAHSDNLLVVHLKDGTEIIGYNVVF